jgi:adenylate cyclase
MRATLIGVSLGVAAAGLALALSITPAGINLENSSYDWRLRATAQPDTARKDIVFVEINDSTIRALEPVFGRWPWPRVVHAGIIDYLTRAKARVIAYDVLFLEGDTRASFPVGDRTMTGAESDAALAASIKSAGNVVLLSDATYEGLQSGADGSTLVPPSVPGPAWTVKGFDARPALRLPLPLFASGAAAVGHNLYKHDENDRGTARSFNPFIEVGPHTVPSLGMAAALLSLKIAPSDVTRTPTRLAIGATSMPLLNGTRVLLDYRGPFQRGAEDAPQRLYHTESAFDVLLSEEKAAAGETPPIDPSVFRDKVVFVGVGAAGLYDVVVTPFTDSGSTPGVFLHAALADDVLSSRYLRKASRASTWAMSLAGGIAAGVVALMLPVWWAIAAVSAAVVIFVAWLKWEFAHQVWFAAAAPIGATAIALFVGTAWNYFVEGRDKRRIKKLFGRYVSKSVFEQLQADPSLAHLGGTRREMSVLFSDIRGFTAASENATPESVVAQLNEYFDAMVKVLHAHNGTLDKYVGDMVMGLFGAPVNDPKHAENAVNCAREMVLELSRLNARWKAEGRKPFDIGIGVNSGPMIAGNIGAESIMSYTVIGDAVNLASRLESLNKEFHTRIIISAATRTLLTRTDDVTPLGDVKVKGRTQAVAIFEVRVPFGE